MRGILISERRTAKAIEIKRPAEGGNTMDILITMAYTALMTFVMVKVTELVPSEKEEK